VITPLSSFYPTQSSERDRWILSQRPERNVLDPHKPYAFFVEEECSAAKETVPVATVLLTNRECPWRCLMCDLWRNTLTETVPIGAIPGQIDYALAQLPAARQIKLYNSGSFFDRKAIPLEDYSPIATKVGTFERTIVESHPSLLGDTCLRFRDLLPNQLEVAMGLETVHPTILDRLNKRMTLDQFADSAEFLRTNHIELRVFILVQPPFMQRADALHWAQRSLDFAFDCDATAATLIPTRGGNGVMEVLRNQGEFSPPGLETLESVMEYGIELNRGRVFADLWDIQANVDACPECHKLRTARLHTMNLVQHVLPRATCEKCEGRS
jgi:radical SAM enzyme (TIGR01210 family)